MGDLNVNLYVVRHQSANFSKALFFLSQLSHPHLFNSEYVFKVVVIGDTGVGKSALMYRFTVILKSIAVVSYNYHWNILHQPTMNWTMNQPTGGKIWRRYRTKCSWHGFRKSRLFAGPHFTRLETHLSCYQKDKCVQAKDGKRVQLSVWDTAGQEKMGFLTSSFYRGAQGVIVVFDVTNPESFKNVTHWLDEIST